MGLRATRLLFTLQFLRLKKKLCQRLLTQFDPPNQTSYREFLNSYIHGPNLTFYQRHRPTQDFMLSWLLLPSAPDFGGDVSASVCPPRPQGGMVMNWVCCLFNFRSGSSLRETLIISRLSVYPGKWRSRTLKVSILVSAFVAGVLEFSKGLGCVRDQLIGFFHRFCCTGKQNGLGTSQTKI